MFLFCLHAVGAISGLHVTCLMTTMYKEEEEEEDVAASMLGERALTTTIEERTVMEPRDGRMFCRMCDLHATSASY